ncbi:MAG: 16S rRNA (cytidine(1402)-2'-O)-methyltransferase [Deltaproteobacteria bacterium]|nr:16S rRNA (cytidine(1402)-2'-O)-methyltransferase [Deltaproteobacteria bacterium]
MNSGTLYIISTPIGDKEDISIHAIEILKQLKVLACEDTRDSQRLLKDLGIAIDGKRFISYYDEIERQKHPVLIDHLKQGMDLGLLSSRGTPLISDPGYVLIRKAIEEKIPLKVLPGPSAFMVALIYSGLAPDKFIFLGFPPRKKNKQYVFFEKFSKLGVTLIFYESPRRLKKTFENIFPLFSGWQICLGRELTKTHQEIVRGTLEEVMKNYDVDGILGEITIVLSPALTKR